MARIWLKNGWPEFCSSCAEPSNKNWPKERGGGFRCPNCGDVLESEKMYKQKKLEQLRKKRVEELEEANELLTIYHASDLSSSAILDQKPHVKERAKSVLLLSGLLGGSTDVVLDGANIIHGGSNGNGMDGRRLISAMKYYENKGYLVHTVLKQETYHYMKKKKVPGLKRIGELVAESKILLFRKNDDHLAIILALKHHAWLVTHDTFKTHDNTKPKERELHPEWFEGGGLDARTRGTNVQGDGWISSGFDWRIEGNNFYDTEIADIKFLSSWYNSDNKLVVKKAHSIEDDILKIQAMIDELDSISVEQKSLLTQCKNKIGNFIKSFSNKSESKDIKSIIKSLMMYDLKQICHNRSLKNDWPLEDILIWYSNWHLSDDQADIKETTRIKVKDLCDHLDDWKVPYIKSGGKRYLAKLYFSNIGDKNIIENLIIEDIAKRGLYLFHEENKRIFCINSWKEFSSIKRNEWDELYSKLMEPLIQ